MKCCRWHGHYRFSPVFQNQAAGPPGLSPQTSAPIEVGQVFSQMDSPRPLGEMQGLEEDSVPPPPVPVAALHALKEEMLVAEEASDSDAAEEGTESGYDTAPETPNERIVAPDESIWMSKCDNLVKELKETEEAYVDDLQLMLTLFVRPALKEEYASCGGRHAAPMLKMVEGMIDTLAA